MLIPEKLVAFFIGTNGKAIKKLMYDANTDIIVLSEKKESKFRCVKVTGKIKNTIKTFSIIYRIFSEKGFYLDDKHSNNASISSDSKLKLVFPNKVVEHIID